MSIDDLEYYHDFHEQHIVTGKALRIIFLLTPGIIHIRKAFGSFDTYFPNQDNFDFVPLFRQNINGDIIDANENDVIDKLTKAINDSQATSKDYNLQDIIKTARNIDLQFVIEDEVPNLLRIKELANEMCNLILEGRKDDSYMFLQKKWLKWAITQREIQKLIGSEENDEKKELMTSLRNEQVCHILLNHGQHVQKFAEKAEQLQNDSPNLNIFYIVLKSMFDKTVSSELSVIRQQYNSAWIKFMEAKARRTEGEQTSLKDLLGDIEKRVITCSSLSINHIVRDMGQIYTCYIQHKSEFDTKNHSYPAQFPDIISSFALSGMPFEIMDGYACSIPIEWVVAILDNLNEKLGDKKVFVVSIVGVQSSGKSTLLNAMFGMQFPVSIGRCTRGVNAQLVKVNNSDLDIEYILVVDTEGLRAIELASAQNKHDNEIATLVIGMGDLTIVNIKGENYADMKDVLQITVHAFLRMKLVQKRIGKCIFIHQNVVGAGAQDYMAASGHSLQVALDASTVEAANLENVAGIKSFNQIIQYDWSKHVFYFSDLWKGDPPMAPTNPGYSKCASRAKETVFDILKENSEQLRCSMQTVSSRIKQLWDSMLSDDFVFRFRNSLEILSFANLDKQIRKFSSKFYQEVSETVRRQSKERIIHCNSIQEITAVNDDILTKTMAEVKHKLHKQQQQLQDFCKEHPALAIADILLDIIKTKSDEIRNQIIRTLETEKTRRITELMILELGRNKSLLIQERAEKLTQSFKGQERDISDDELITEFESVWKTSDNKIDQLDSRKSITADVESVLKSSFPMHEHILRDALKCQNISEPPKIKQLSGLFEYDPTLFSLKRDIGMKNDSIIIQNLNWEMHRKDAINVLDSILQKIDHYLDKVSAEVFENRTWYITTTEIISILRAHINRHNQSQGYAFYFLPACEIHLTVNVCRQAIETFHKKQEQIDERQGVIAQCKQLKSKLFAMYRSKVRNIADDILLPSLVHDILRESLKVHISEDISKVIHREICKRFQNKHVIDTTMCKYLSERESFAEVIEYLTYPKAFVRSWLEEYIKKTYFARRKSDGCLPEVHNATSRYFNIAKYEIQKKETSIIEVLQEMDIYYQSKERCILTDWLTQFCKLALRKGIYIPNADYVHISKTMEINNISDFIATIRNDTQNLISCLAESFEKFMPLLIMFSSRVFLF